MHVRAPEVSGVAWYWFMVQQSWCSFVADICLGVGIVGPELNNKKAENSFLIEKSLEADRDE